jgi:hypothetical protein
LLTERALGRKIGQQSLPSLIGQRETGSCGIARSFTSGQKCQLMNRFLPNCRETVVRLR